MSDFEKLKSVFDSFGIGYTESKMDDEMLIECKEGSHKVGGYPCFFTDFTFDSDGAFQGMGAWE